MQAFIQKYAFLNVQLVHTQKYSPVLFFLLFLRAQVTGSPGAQGFSTYLGVLIEPGDRAKMRERLRERDREGGERERERHTYTHRDS